MCVAATAALWAACGAAFAQPASTVIVGEITPVWGDPEPGADPRPHLVFILTRDDGRTTFLDVAPQIVSQAGGLAALTRRRVAVTVGAARPEAPGRRPALAIEPLAPPAPEAAVTGNQPWISVLCKFSDVPDEPENLSFFTGMYANVMGGQDHFWREVSYDQIDLVGSGAVGWFTLPHPHAHYVPTPGSGTSADRTALRDDCLAEAGAAAEGYAGINLMFNDLLDCCAWGGGGVTWNPPWAFRNGNIISHEMGHGFGLPHSNNSDLDSTPYDNPWDVMSASWNYALSDPVYGTQGKHMNAPQKDLLSWLAPQERFVADTNGSYSVRLDSLSAPSADDYRMVFIRAPDALRTYAVEGRDHTGYDAALAGEAVIIHEVVDGRSEPAWVVDADDPPATFSDTEGVMWRAGETFTSSEDGISITVDSIAGGHFDVTLDLDRPNRLLLQDLESGPGNLQLSGIWHTTTACAAAMPGHSTPTALYAGVDATCDYDTAVAGGVVILPVDLRGVKAPVRLSFAYYLETEPDCCDDASLYLLPDAGGLITLATNYPSAGVAPLNDPSGGWQDFEVDLDAWIGEEFRLMFSFSADGGDNAFPGFYLDDLGLTGCFDVADLQLTAMSVAVEEIYSACVSILATDFQILSEGIVTFEAGDRVVLGEGFEVGSGGQFTAVTDP